MNTDAILEFIVDYYIWFIIGGSILILALIGFIADKKNNRKKAISKKNDSKIKSQIIRTEEDITVDKNLSDNDIDYNVNDSNNLETNDNRKPETINLNDNEDEKEEYDSSTFNDTKNDIQKEIINDNIKETEKMENIDGEENHYNEVLGNDDVKEELQYIDNLEMKDDKNNESSVNSNDELKGNNIVEDGIDDNQYELYRDSDKYSDISDDIDKNTNNNASNIEIIDVKEQQNLDKNLINNRLVHFNDSDNVPLNISYSQLKDIVEEIIAEKESEPQDYGNNINKDLDMYTKDVEKTNFGQENVENIKQLDEDEDDVWKF